MAMQPAADKVLLGTWVNDELKDPDHPKKSLARRNEKFFIARELLKQGHMHLRGRTGSGKTSRGIMPLIKQLAQPYKLSWETSTGKKYTVEERDTIMVFDFGGDKPLLNHTKQVADELGRIFRIFTLDAKKSHRFDPMQSIPDDDNRIISICNLLLRALSLDAGLAYGGSYYSSRNMEMLLAVCEEMIAKRKRGQRLSLKDIDKYLCDPANKVKDAEHIRSIFRFLLHYPQLEPLDGDTEAIDMCRAIANREIIYFFCPTLLEGTTSRQIGGLGFFNALHAAERMAEEKEGDPEERPLPHLHMIADEFQEVAGSGFGAMLPQCRKYGVSLYLANQTTEQLISRDADLAAAVRDNTTTKLYFTVTGRKDIDELLTFSKEYRDKLKSTQEDGSVFNLGAGAEGRASESEYITTVLKKNEILECSASDGEFFVLVDDGKGHREPRRIFRDHIMSVSEYRRLKGTPIPNTQVAPTKGRRAQQSGVPSWLQRHFEDQKAPQHAKRMQLLSEVLKEVQREEQVQL